MEAVNGFRERDEASFSMHWSTADKTFAPAMPFVPFGIFSSSHFSLTLTIEVVRVQMFSLL